MDSGSNVISLDDLSILDDSRTLEKPSSGIPKGGHMILKTHVSFKIQAQMSDIYFLLKHQR